MTTIKSCVQHSFTAVSPGPPTNGLLCLVVILGQRPWGEPHTRAMRAPPGEWLVSSAEWIWAKFVWYFAEILNKFQIIIFHNILLMNSTFKDKKSDIVDVIEKQQLYQCHHYLAMSKRKYTVAYLTSMCFNLFTRKLHKINKRCENSYVLWKR